MRFWSELRYPTKWYAKLITAILALAFFTLLATGTISGFLLYRILTPAHTREDINTQSFPGHPSEVTFAVPDIGQRQGWLFPGLRGAPTIFLGHGYQSNRGELLTLVSALQDNQYNVFLFDFSAHGSSPGRTTSGFRETEELRAAIAAIEVRGDVDRERIGIWGANMGGYTALAVAAGNPHVRALVVDSVYDRPEDMVRLQVQRSGLGALPFMGHAVEKGFHWLNASYRNELPLSARLSGLAGVAKLFIQAGDEPELAEATRELFIRAPRPSYQVILARGNYAVMLDEEKRAYENRIINFFLFYLPPAGGARQ